MRTVTAFAAGLLMMSGTLTPASAQAPASPSERDANLAVAPEEYRIGPEDMLQISVWKNDAVGRFELKSWTTVLDVLAMAGGFSQFASRTRILILHPDGKAMKKIPFNYNKIGSDQENFYLRNGDVVVVP